jgi:hypothetical protein
MLNDRSVFDFRGHNLLAMFDFACRSSLYRNLIGPRCLFPQGQPLAERTEPWEVMMGGIIYLVGLIVIVLAILSFLGLR